MGREEMVRELEKYLEDAGFENVMDRYLNGKCDEEIKVLYEAASNDFGKHLKI